MREPTLTEKCSMLFGFILAFAGATLGCFKTPLVLTMAVFSSGLVLALSGFLPNRPIYRQVGDERFESVSGSRPMEIAFYLGAPLAIGYLILALILPNLSWHCGLFPWIAAAIDLGLMYLLVLIGRSAWSEKVQKGGENGK